MATSLNNLRKDSIPCSSSSKLELRRALQRLWKGSHHSPSAPEHPAEPPQLLPISLPQLWRWWCLRGKGSAFVGSISLPQASHITWLWQPVGSVQCPGHRAQLGMWHIPLPPEALASCKEWGSLTCPKKRKGSRNVRPLHIQDWKPSAKDEVSVRTRNGLVERRWSPAPPDVEDREAQCPHLAEEVLPLQPHCGHLQGGQWQRLLIQHRALGSTGADPQLLPLVSGEVTAHSAWAVGRMFSVSRSFLGKSGMPRGTPTATSHPEGASWWSQQSRRGTISLWGGAAP